MSYYLVKSVMDPSVRDYLPAVVKCSMDMEFQRNLTDQFCLDFAKSFKKEFKFDLKSNKKKPEEPKQIILNNNEEVVNSIKSWLSTYQKLIAYMTNQDLSHLILKHKADLDPEYVNKYTLLFQSSLFTYIQICEKFQLKMGDKYENLDLKRDQILIK